MDLVSRVLSRRLVPVGLLLGAISLIFSSITGVEQRERTGERSSTDVPRIAISPNSARTSVSTPGVVARLRLLSITISLSSESMNIGIDDEVETFGYQKRLFGFAGFVEVEIVEIVVMDGLGQTVVGFVGPFGFVGFVE